MQAVRESTVAVIAFPHLYTTLIARVLRADGRYLVEAPDVLSEAWEPAVPFDAVVASLPVPREWGRVLLQLPDDFGQPVTISVGDLTVQIDVDEHHPLQDVLDLLEVALGPQGASGGVLDLANAGTGWRRQERPQTE